MNPADNQITFAKTSQVLKVYAPTRPETEKQRASTVHLQCGVNDAEDTNYVEDNGRSAHIAAAAAKRMAFLGTDNTVAQAVIGVLKISHKAIIGRVAFIACHVLEVLAAC